MRLQHWIMSLVVTLTLSLAALPQAHATVVTPQTLGDNTVETIYNGSALSNILSGHGIVSPDLDPIHLTNDQVQYQQFTVTGGVTTVTMELLGTIAGYDNKVGIFTAPTSNPTNRTLHQAFVNNVDPIGTTFALDVAADSIFGFYLLADAFNGTPKGSFYSINALNSDNAFNRVTDHFVMLEASTGLIVAVEDLNYDKNTYKLGDQDYNDVVFRVNTTNKVVPEPASLGLLGLGSLMLLGRRRRQRVA